MLLFYTTQEVYTKFRMVSLESVMLTYGDYTGNALEALTHTEFPWIEARGNLSHSENCNNVISAATMRSFYQSIYAGGDA